MGVLIFLACIVLFLVAVRLAQGVGGKVMAQLVLFFVALAAIMCGGMLAMGVFQSHQAAVDANSQRAEIRVAEDQYLAMTPSEKEIVSRREPTDNELWAHLCLESPREIGDICPKR